MKITRQSISTSVTKASKLTSDVFELFMLGAVDFRSSTEETGDLSCFAPLATSTGLTAGGWRISPMIRPSWTDRTVSQ